MDTETKDQCGTQVRSQGEDQDGVPGLPAAGGKGLCPFLQPWPFVAKTGGKAWPMRSPLTG